jgi:lysophospholipase L1-like esterase
VALPLLLLGLLPAVPVLALQATPSAATAAPVSRWERSIARFEEADRLAPPAPGQVLFVGSSSIVRWTTLAEDFPSIDLLNRGFGGSQISDVLEFADRVIVAYRPRHVVLYAGDNDADAGRTADEIFADYKGIVERVHAALPDTRISFISMKPSPSRWDRADVMIAGNAMIKAFADADPRLDYIDVWGPMLGVDGTPRAELFVEDMLHMNPHGYVLWRSIVAGYVER